MKYLPITLYLLIVQNSFAQEYQNLDSLFQQEQFEQVIQTGSELTYKEPEKVMMLKAKSLQQLLREEDAFGEMVSLQTYYPNNQQVRIPLLASALKLQRNGWVTNQALQWILSGDVQASYFVYALEAAQKSKQMYELNQLSELFFQHFPNDNRSRLWWGSALQKLKLYDSSLVILLPAKEQLQSNMSFIDHLLRGYYYTQQYDKVVVNAQMVMGRGIYIPNLILLHLQSLQKQNRNQETIELLQQLISAGEVNEHYYLNGARAAIAVKDYSKAREWLQQGLQLTRNPLGIQFYKELAILEIEKGKAANAMKYYDTAYLIFNDPYILYEKGLAMLQQGKEQEANQFFKQYSLHPLVVADTSTENKNILLFIQERKKKN